MATAIDVLPEAAASQVVPYPETGSISSAIAAVADRVRRSVPVVFGRGGNGAGVVWRPDGQIVTNAHVVRDDRADVLFSDGRRFTGIVAARHPDRDIAVIKIAVEDLPAVEVGDSSTVRPGQFAIAIGHPVGFREAVTAGIVVAAGQAATQGGPRTGDYLQTDVTLLPGNSGGPLLDAWGRVIGINSMVSGQLSLAIPTRPSSDSSPEGSLAALSTLASTASSSPYVGRMTRQGSFSRRSWKARRPTGPA